MKRRSRIWLWFFAVLAALTAVAAGIEIWFNLSQQLTPQEVEDARALWRRTVPAEYDLEYTLTRQSREAPHYQAVVRDREVVSVTFNGQELEPALYPLHDLPPLFAAVEKWLADDPSRRDGFIDHESAATDSATYRVRVGDGERVVTRDGHPVPPKLAASYLPEAQYEAILRRLEIDRQPDAGRVYCVATFDRTDGRLLRYVRSVSATRDRVQIQAAEPKPPGTH